MTLSNSILRANHHFKKTGGILSACLLASLSVALPAGAEETGGAAKSDPLHLRTTVEAALSRPCPEAEKEKLIWVGGFEEGCFQFVVGGRRGDTQGPLWAQAQFQGPYAAEFVGEPVRSGTAALRLEWRKDGLRKDNTSKKAMIHFGRTSSPGATDRWYGFSLFVPSKEFISNAAEPKDYFVILFQLHDTPDQDLGETYRKPLITLAVIRGALCFGYSYDLEKLSPENKNIDAHRTSLEICPLGDLGDRWVDFVIHARLGLKEDGVAQVWMDGKPVVDLQGINLGYNDAVGPYPSWGMYSYGSDSDRRVLFLDEVRIGGRDASYESVAPGKMDGSARPEAKPAPEEKHP